MISPRTAAQDNPYFVEGDFGRRDGADNGAAASLNLKASLEPAIVVMMIKMARSSGRNWDGLQKISLWAIHAPVNIFCPIQWTSGHISEHPCCS